LYSAGMMGNKGGLLLCCILFAYLQIITAQPCDPVDPASNFDGSFETGDFTTAGWTSTDIQFPSWDQGIYIAGSTHPVTIYPNPTIVFSRLHPQMAN